MVAGRLAASAVTRKYHQAFAPRGHRHYMNTSPVRFLFSLLALPAAFSSAFVFDLHAQPFCSPLPSGLVSWWRAESNALDQVGSNNGNITGNVTFGPGMVGQAFVSDGNVGSTVNVGNPVDLHLQNFTIEAWIKRASDSVVTLSPSGNGLIFGFGSGSYGFCLDVGGRPVLTQIDVNNVTLGTAITDTQFHHLAVTKSGSTVIFYIDGMAYPVPPYNPTFGFSSSAA